MSLAGRERRRLAGPRSRPVRLLSLVLATVLRQNGTLRMARVLLDEWFWSVESAPMEGAETYWKVPFERVGGTRPLMVDRDSTVSWTPAEKDERFLEVVEAVIAQSPDAGDIARVREMGASVAARHLIDSVPDWAMSRLPGWWELLTMSGKVAGFVMPVTYDECAREGLDEATILHLGVVDGFRRDRTWSLAPTSGYSDACRPRGLAHLLRYGVQQLPDDPPVRVRGVDEIASSRATSLSDLRH